MADRALALLPRLACCLALVAGAIVGALACGLFRLTLEAYPMAVAATQRPARPGPDAEIMMEELPEQIAPRPVAAHAPPVTPRPGQPPTFSLLRLARGGCDRLRQPLGGPAQLLFHFDRNCTRLPLALAPDQRHAVTSRGSTLLEIDLVTGASQALPVPCPGRGATLAWYDAHGALWASFVNAGTASADKISRGTFARVDEHWELRAENQVVGDVRSTYRNLAETPPPRRCSTPESRDGPSPLRRRGATAWGPSSCPCRATCCGSCSRPASRVAGSPAPWAPGTW